MCMLLSMISPISITLVCYSKYGRGFSKCTNSITDKLSPWYSSFVIFVRSLVMDWVLQLTCNLVNHYFVRLSTAVIWCFGTFTNFRTCIIQLWAIESKAICNLAIQCLNFASYLSLYVIMLISMLICFDCFPGLLWCYYVVSIRTIH